MLVLMREPIFTVLYNETLLLFVVQRMSCMPVGRVTRFLYVTCRVHPVCSTRRLAF